jgi:hypothetical protein
MNTAIEMTVSNTSIHNISIFPEIDMLNFDRIKHKLSLKKSDDGKEWSQEKIEIAEKEYKRYLTLVKLYQPKSIVPSKLMDEFWHMHILDTKAYREDCQQIFGKFIDHFPYFGIYGDEDRANLLESFEETKGLYKRTFGEEVFDADVARCEDHPCHAPSDCACRGPGTCK